MQESSIIDLTGTALMLVLLLSLPTILVATFVGLLVSFFQALTQIQEQTLSYAIKLIAVIVTLFLTARWAGNEMYAFALRIFELFPLMPK